MLIYICAVFRRKLKSQCCNFWKGFCQQHELNFLLERPEWTKWLEFSQVIVHLHRSPDAYCHCLSLSASFLLPPWPPPGSKPSSTSSDISLLPSERQKGTFILQIPPYLFLPTVHLVCFFFLTWSGKCFRWALAKLRVFEAIATETSGDFCRLDQTHTTSTHTRCTPEQQRPSRGQQFSLDRGN